MTKSTTAKIRTILLGADGFIGRHLAYGLRDLGHSVVCVARNPGALGAMGFETIAADLTAPHAQTTEFWQKHLSTTDHLVNCAGLLNGTDAAFQAVHVTAPTAAYAALPTAATSVLISAVGIETQTKFARYRRAGETAALAHNVTALRCGLVLSDTSYGGSSLIRALAAVPFYTPVPNGPEPAFNPIHATDLAALVDATLRHPPATNPIEVGGPETIALRDMLSHYRTWLGLPKTRFITLPNAAMQALGWIGDFCKMGPISRTALKQLNAGVLADTTAMTAEITAAPRGFSTFANARPVGTSDLWHARLYFAKPATRLCLAFLWLFSGILGLLLPADQFLPLLNTPIPDTVLVAFARAGGVIDLLLAAALIRDWRPKKITQLQFAMVASYTLVFTLLNPALWLLPLGGLLKNIPILMLLILHTLLQKER